jgi:hypothetical protein
MFLRRAPQRPSRAEDAESAQIGRRVTPGLDRIVFRKPDRRPVGKVFEVLVEGAALVHLEVAPTDPARRRRINHAGDGVTDLGKHFPHTSVEQQRLIVFDDELVELRVELRHQHRDREQSGAISSIRAIAHLLTPSRSGRPERGSARVGRVLREAPRRPLTPDGACASTAVDTFRRVQR